MTRAYILVAGLAIAMLMVSSIQECDRRGSTPNLRMRPPGITMAHILYTLKAVR